MYTTNRLIKVFDLIIAAFVILYPLQVHGNAIALTFTDYASATRTVDETWGWSFTVNSQVTLTDFGVWDGNNDDPFGATGDGLISPHVVSIWTSVGTLVASATVPAGDSGNLSEGFRFVSVPSLLLQPGDYVIGAYYSSFDDWTAIKATDISTPPEILYTGGRAGSGNVFPPGNDFGFIDGNFGPNFEFTTGSSEVPESGSTILLMALGIVLLVAVRSRVVA